MPRGDGTGPMGAGAFGGRGQGICIGAGVGKCGLGLGRAFMHGFGGGVGQNFAANQNPAKTRKELLIEQKNVLYSRLEDMDKQLQNL